MKLSVRMLQPRHSSFGVVPMLCDEHGEPLPNQRCVTVKAPMDDVVTVTVEFVVGTDLRIVGEEC